MSQEKRAEVLARNPRRIFETILHTQPRPAPTPVVISSSHKAFHPWGALAPFFPVGTTQPGQESIPFGGARRKWARPCQAGGGEGFHSHCSHSDSRTMGEGVGGRRCLSVCLTSRSRITGAFQPSYCSCAFSLPLDFSHPFFFLLPTPVSCLLGAQGRRG